MKSLLCQFSKQFSTLPSAGTFLLILTCLVSTLPFVLPGRVAAAGSDQNFPVRINEIFADGTSNYPDWMELYNASSRQIDLKGYWLSDKIDAPAWQIRDHIMIPPNGFRVFICDRKGAYDHTNFRLSSVSGQTALFSPAGELMDALSYDNIPKLHSLGRYPDGSDSLNLHSSPTMGEPNKPGTPTYTSEKTSSAMVSFSRDEGRCPAAFSLRLTAPTDCSIHYTRDGKIPDQSSSRYRTPLTIDKTTVIRAVAIDPQGHPGPVQTRSYVFGEDKTKMPVISLVTDPDNLWNPETGIYAEGAGFENIPNWKHSWRRPVRVSYFGRDGQWTVDAKFRIFGGASRGRPQKSFAIYAKDNNSPYGIRFKLFPELENDYYPGFILRNGGDAWLRSQILDAFFARLTAGRTAFDSRPYRPAIAYLNGQYWGLYGLRGLANKNDLLARHGIRNQSAIIKETAAELADDTGPFADYVSQPADADYRQSLPSMNFDSYLDYMCIELFSGNRDWIDNNIKSWRVKGSEGKWRWILYDLDRAFHGKRSDPVDKDPFIKLLNMPGRRGLMFSELMRNRRFRRDFCARMNVHMLTTLAPSRMKSVLETITTQIRPQIDRHFDRWRWQWRLDRLFITRQDWENHVASILDYGRHRPRYMYAFLEKYCGYGPPVETSLSISTKGNGSIEVEGIPVPERQFSGPVLKGLTITVKAVPAPGFTFLKWVGETATQGPVLQLQSGDTISATAVFIRKKQNNDNE